MRFSPPAASRLEAGESKTVNLTQPVRDELARWTPAQPTLYGVLVEVKSDDTVLDRRVVRFGWRQFGFRDQRFTLNGEPLRLNIELCRFFGVAHLSPRHAWAWYRMLEDCHISAVSVYDVTYYGCWPQPLGLRDLTRAPAIEAGVPWVAADAAAPVLVVDLGSRRDAAGTNVARIEQTLQAGGTVLVWGVTPKNIASANALLPLPVRAVARSASSLLPAKDHPLAAAPLLLQ